VKGDLNFRFSSNIWLGNGREGLIWQAESDKDWNYEDPNRAIEILPRTDLTTFRAHWINVPTQLASGQTLHYKFALEATPIKPRLRDAWDLRIMRDEPYGRSLELPDETIEGVPALRYFSEIGLRHLFVFINDIWPYPMPVHQKYIKALHRLVQAAHAEGLKLYEYNIHQRYPVVTPEFDIHGLHMAKRPVHQYVPPINPIGAKRPGGVAYGYGADSQGTVFSCPKSLALQDSYIHALAERLDTFGDDGVYLDGTSHVVPCHNLMHGCGYQSTDGSVAPTRPVFAVRDFMRRIYTVIKTRNPEGVVDVHCSFGQNMAAVAYADNLWTGEQWHHLRHTGTDHVASELTFDKFRTEFTGLQSGVSADTLAYRLGPPLKVAGISLLHDVPVRANSIEREIIEKGQREAGKEYYKDRLIKLWDVRERFGAEEEVARKLFYYENQDYVRVSPGDCYSTLIWHPTNGVLAVVSNLSTEPKTVSVDFDLDRLNLSGKKIHAVNAIYDHPLEMSLDGEIPLSLDAEDWTYILIRPVSAQNQN
jgi:hypothetical protein